MSLNKERLENKFREEYSKLNERQQLAVNTIEGPIIEYKVKPLLGIPVYWMTEITHVKERVFFADEQRKGPYKLWHHQHHFKDIPGGVEMTDIVHYKSPGWIFEGVIDRLIVRPKLETIFKFRYDIVEQQFGKWKE